MRHCGDAPYRKDLRADRARMYALNSVSGERATLLIMQAPRAGLILHMAGPCNSPCSAGGMHAALQIAAAICPEGNVRALHNGE